MLASTPTSEYMSFRARSRDGNMSPSCRAVHNSTPPRLASDHTSSCNSPMLTPSPLRRRPLFANNFTPDAIDNDDIFLQSPFRSPTVPNYFPTSNKTKPLPISAEDPEGAIFLENSTAAPFLPIFFPTSESPPLRTPVKQIHRIPSRPVLSIKHLNALPHPATGTATSSNSPVRVGVGTKRKSTPLINNCSTPLRQRVLTPLSISSSKNADSKFGGMAFDRLAPLPAPRFSSRTPHSKAETEVHLKRQTKTMTRLKLTDLNHSGDSFGGDDDSGCEVGEDFGDALFLSGKVQTPARQLRETLSSRGTGKVDEVAEAISPSGHITKRRARSRPLSLELLESVRQSLSPSPAPNDVGPKKYASRTSNGIVFPSGPRTHSKNPSQSSSSSETASPLLRNRVNADATRLPPRVTLPSRVPLNRLESAGTLFFGPTISSTTTNNNTRTATPLPSAVASLSVRPRKTRLKLPQRHSYAGPGCESASAVPWKMMQPRSTSPSPRSSPLSLPQCDTSLRADGSGDSEDMLFGEISGPQNSSFVFSITEGTPSPRNRKSTGEAVLPKKYKLRDSGVVLSDDDEDMGMGSASGDYLNVMPGASTSVSSIFSDGDEGLVTPGAGPGSGSGWPEAAVVVDSFFDDMENGFGRSEGGVDAFILRTLAAGAKGAQEGTKKVPGTPVKKVKTSHLAGERPWQSAIANRVGFGFGFDLGGEKKVPRKSLPAAFPALGKKGTTIDLTVTDSDGEGDGEEVSPSWRRHKYGGLGLGRPSVAASKENVKDNASAIPRTGWLMRRSSSGAFSFGGGESLVGTPTRRRDRDWSLLPRLPMPFSPSKNKLKLSPARSTSGSSSSSVTTPNSPTPRHPLVSSCHKGQAEVRQYSGPSAHDQPGRFEREFVQVDEVGSGEFGKVIKARLKGGHEEEVFAVKKSKTFEGVRHRLRLREEVVILQHLSDAVAAGTGVAQSRHPNVLAYVDSWEEDARLFIRTELCELGNFGRFLWEYGRVFPRLDEARVWKIIADLSNGLRFIHEAGVIHLDLKPANIFVTGHGRFKIGDFGMASLWPRSALAENGGVGSFEREGDKLYLAPEVLQGQYGKAADIFSLGMTILETATNIVVPDQGEPWHRLRQEKFEQVDLHESPELLELIKSMMRREPAVRVGACDIFEHPVVARARESMEMTYAECQARGTPVFSASPLAGVPNGFLEEILGRRGDEGAMDLGP